MITFRRKTFLQLQLIEALDTIKSLLTTMAETIEWSRINFNQDLRYHRYFLYCSSWISEFAFETQNNFRELTTILEQNMALGLYYLFRIYKRRKSLSVMHRNLTSKEIKVSVRILVFKLNGDYDHHQRKAAFRHLRPESNRFPSMTGYNVYKH